MVKTSTLVMLTPVLPYIILIVILVVVGVVIWWKWKGIDPRQKIKDVVTETKTKVVYTVKEPAESLKDVVQPDRSQGILKAITSITNPFVRNWNQ